MATEYPNRYTLKACLFMGSKTDLTTGMSELARLFPDNVEKDDEGWKFVNVTPHFVQELTAVIIGDKVKLTELFESTLLWHLGWVIGRQFTTLFLSCREPALYFEPQKWKWVPIQVTADGLDTGDDG